MLVKNQADVAAASYSLVEFEDGGKVYWKGWIKVIGGQAGQGGKEMLILTVSSVSVKQQPVNVPQFFELLDVLELNVNGKMRKVNGDVSSLNCTGSRKGGKDGKGGGEILGVKFGEVWMDASASAVPKLNLSDYGTFTTEMVNKIQSASQHNIKSYESQVYARMIDVEANGKKEGVSENDKEELRKIWKLLKGINDQIVAKKVELGIVDKEDNLPF